MGPSPAVAATRSAVRACLGLTPAVRAGDLVLVACSGGADSLALAAATAFEARRAGVRAGGVTVDHDLQAGSAERAAAVARVLRQLGLLPVLRRRVTVAVGPASGGPEGAARTARHDALLAAAEEHGAAAVLLGHSRDDQAETVLLGLARGSGARSLAGMSPVRGLLRRPFLGLDRALLRTACADGGLEPWEDPHNVDPAYARVRVRSTALPVLEETLGPGIAAALARTAAHLRADADALDRLAEDALAAAHCDGGLDTRRLAGLLPAVRTRVLRLAALAAGCPAGDLTAGHIEQTDRLVTDWRGQRWVDLPGQVRAVRRCDRLLLTSGSGHEQEPS